MAWTLSSTWSGLAEMYELVGWIFLSETADASDVGGLSSATADLEALLLRLVPPTATARIDRLNGECVLSIFLVANRRRTESEAVEKVLAFVAQRLPGSWGLIYDRTDDAAQYSPNAFRVRRLARGRFDEFADPFLSPLRPTVED